MANSRNFNAVWRPSTFPPLEWKAPKQKLESHPCGVIVFDSTVADQQYAFGGVVAHQKQVSLDPLDGDGGIINCVYIKPSSEMCWVLDHRLHCEEVDGKSKRQHVQDMLADLVKSNPVPFSTVIMKSWYATESIMLLVERLEKIYWCPVRSNRLVRGIGKNDAYVPASAVLFEEGDFICGKSVLLKSFPKDLPVKLFHVETIEEKTAYVVTNHMIENSVQIAEIMYGVYRHTQKRKTIN
jgi:hypothetical protein